MIDKIINSIEDFLKENGIETREFEKREKTKTGSKVKFRYTDEFEGLIDEIKSILKENEETRKF